MYNESIQRTGTGAADNAVLLTVGPGTDPQVKDCWEHQVSVSAGTVDIEVLQIEGGSYSDSATVPVAVQLQSTTTPGTLVQEIAAGQTGLLWGHFAGIRLKQKGATGATATLTSRPR